jgi:hypothetical protein
MKKFSTNYNKVNESVSVEETSLEDKISQLIDENISVQIDGEPSVNENYEIEGKEELVEILAESYREVSEKNHKELKESLFKQYHNYIDRKSIDVVLDLMVNEMAIRDESQRNVSKRVIDLRGPAGNAFALLGAARNLCEQLKEVDSEKYNWSVVEKELTSGDYENLIQVFDKYFGDFVDLQR